jgi:hypothetical protein
MLSQLHDCFLYPEHPRMPIGHRASNFLFRGLRQILLLLGVDFVWRDTVGTQSYWLAFSRQYSVHRRIYPDYQENLAHLVRLMRQKYPDGKVIDIGANIGDSILQIHRLTTCQVLAIDPITTFLERNFGGCPDVQIVKAYVSTTENGFKEDSGRHSTLKQILTTHPEFAQARVLKIDTDGSDFAILRHNIEWLKQVHPILFFEFDPMFGVEQGEDGWSTLPLLADAGYSKALVYSSTGAFLISLRVDSTENWKELAHFILRNGPIYYFDLCLFSMDDSDLFEQMRALEMNKAG